MLCKDLVRYNYRGFLWIFWRHSKIKAGVYAKSVYVNTETIYGTWSWMRKRVGTLKPNLSYNPSLLYMNRKWILHGYALRKEVKLP